MRLLFVFVLACSSVNSCIFSSSLFVIAIDPFSIYLETYTMGVSEVSSLAAASVGIGSGPMIGINSGATRIMMMAAKAAISAANPIFASSPLKHTSYTIRPGDGRSIRR